MQNNKKGSLHLHSSTFLTLYIMFLPLVVRDFFSFVVVLQQCLGRRTGGALGPSSPTAALLLRYF